MNKKNDLKSSGIGVGYVSVMIIFVVICLTIFAVFSFRAANSNDVFNERSGEYLREYYAADIEAKEILARLDEAAFNARSANAFDRDFRSAAEEMNVNLSMMQGGFTADYTVDINDRQYISVSVNFFSDKEYEITRWQNVSRSSEYSDQHINVWQGF